MTDLYRDKQYWAVILGGSSGFGLATAHELAKMGINLFIVHRDRRSAMPAIESEFSELRKQNIQVETHNQDATQTTNQTTLIAVLKAVLQTKGRVFVLLHSIAKGNLKPMNAPKNEAALSASDLQLTTQAMAFCWYDWFAAIHQNDLFADRARILALTSAGNKKPWIGYGAVGVAKGALEALMRNMALEFGGQYRINLLQPGITATAALDPIPGAKKMLENAQQRNPSGRATQPTDVGKVVALLCSPAADWLHGIIIPVDGGESLWL